MKKLSGILLFAACSIQVVLAQGLTDGIHPIDGVTVEGRYAPVAEISTRTVIDSVKLAESANLSFAELLTKHTPVFVKTYGIGSLATVSFRGTGASHTRVIWNGIPINNPMLGQVDFSLIPVWMADRVELYHGGGSLQTGSGALGGTISINSAPRWDRKFYGSAVQGVGSYGLAQTFVSAGGGNRKVQLRVRYLYERCDNDFSYYNWQERQRMRLRNAGYDMHGAAADLFYNAGRGNVLSASVWYGYNSRELPRNMNAVYSNATEDQTDTDLRAVLRWKKYSDKLRWELSAGYSGLSLDYRYFKPSDFGFTDNRLDTETHTNSVFGNYRMEYSFSERTGLEVSVDAAYHSAGYRERKPVFSGNLNAPERDTIIFNRPDRFETGIAATLRHDFSPRFSSFILLRGDLSDSGSSPPIFAAGASFALSHGLRLKANGSRNYHRPTLNDLYWRPGGNPDLRTERGYTTDIAAVWSKRSEAVRLDASLTGYMSWIDDWIQWAPGNYFYWTAENLKKVKVRGVEISASVGYASGKFSAELSGNYAFTRSTNETAQSANDLSRGKQLMYVPLHKGNIMGEASYGDWYLWWVWSSVSERFTTSNNADALMKLPAYDVHNATVGRKISAWGCILDLQLRLNNVFDRRYQMLELRPMPGRNFGFLLKVSF